MNSKESAATFTLLTLGSLCFFTLTLNYIFNGLGAEDAVGDAISDSGQSNQEPILVPRSHQNLVRECEGVIEGREHAGRDEDPLAEYGAKWITDWFCIPPR